MSETLSLRIPYPQKYFPHTGLSDTNKRDAGHGFSIECTLCLNQEDSRFQSLYIAETLRNILKCV